MSAQTEYPLLMHPDRVWIKFDERTSMGPVVSDYDPDSTAQDDAEAQRAGWVLYGRTATRGDQRLCADGGPDVLTLDVTTPAGE